jgi:hypothetical protein
MLRAFLFLSLLTLHTFAVERPNVILFRADDMGWRDCGAYGSTHYETPNIDRFAQGAMRFTNAYSQPLCSPTRASLLTGQYSALHHITSATGHQPPQEPGHKFLSETAPPNTPMLLPEYQERLHLRHGMPSCRRCGRALAASDTGRPSVDRGCQARHCFSPQNAGHV